MENTKRPENNEKWKPLWNNDETMQNEQVMNEWTNEEDENPTHDGNENNMKQRWSNDETMQNEQITNEYKNENTDEAMLNDDAAKNEHVMGKWTHEEYEATLKHDEPWNSMKQRWNNDETMETNSLWANITRINNGIWKTAMKHWWNNEERISYTQVNNWRTRNSKHWGMETKIKQRWRNGETVNDEQIMGD